MVRHTTGVNTRFAEGAPDVDWAYQGRLWNGNDPETRTHINPWGNIFRTDGNPPPSDVAVEVGDLSLYILYSGVWQRVTYNKRVDGAMYPATFEGWDSGTTPTVPATVYTGPGSFVVADVAIEDWAYHFYLPRIAITGTIEGIIVSFEARIVSKTAQDVSAYAGTLLAQTGCDYKNSDGSEIRDAFVSSMMPISTSFKRLYGTTLTVEELRGNPPPISLERV